MSLFSEKELKDCHDAYLGFTKPWVLVGNTEKGGVSNDKKTRCR